VTDLRVNREFGAVSGNFDAVVVNEHLDDAIAEVDVLIHKWFRNDSG